MSSALFRACYVIRSGEAARDWAADGANRELEGETDLQPGDGIGLA